MNNFPNVSENSSILLFEKTANYFDSSKAPMRVHALLTDAKIIVILSDPVRRAYSWYQVGCKFCYSTKLNNIFNMSLSRKSSPFDKIGLLLILKTHLCTLS